MMVVRPISYDDLDQLVQLVEQVGFGLTTLPKDRDLLGRRIQQSVAAFQQAATKPTGETYLFVMEDLTRGRVVGISGITSKVGGFEPFYAYKIESALHVSKELNVRKTIQTLHLVQEHNGPCEIGSLFLSPADRREGGGRLLSLSRFLFMAEHWRLFDPVVIAELRGVLDEQGGSPFWEAVGRHFFDVAYPTADYQCMVDKKFIADLMPTHPIYVPLLPQAAQDVIGRVHPNTQPARKILEAEGFTFSGMVDIFETGPILTCALADIGVCQRSRRVTVTDITNDWIGSTAHLIGTTHRDFRACRGAVAPLEEDGARIDRVTALALNVKLGDTIRYATIRPPSAGLHPQAKDTDVSTSPSIDLHNREPCA